MKNKSLFYHHLLVLPSFKISAIATSFLLLISSLSLPAVAQREDGLLDPSRFDVLKKSRPNTYSQPEQQNNPNPFLNQGNSSNPIPASPSEFSSTNNETDYTLGAGDRIRLDIFQVEEYSGEYPVLVDGSISLPLIGKLPVTGLTLDETSDLVASKYTAYLKRPVVTVGLVAPRPLKIGIAGEVDNPGSYEVALTADRVKFPSVTDLIEQAGGITTLADVRNVQVTRTIQGRQLVFNANLWGLLNQNRLDQDISLRDGDTIFIPTVEEINPAEIARLSEASFGLQTDKPINVALVGEVYRPGSYPVQPEQIGRNNGNVANQGKNDSLPPRLTQALGLAGGVKPSANVRNVEVRRKSWDGKEKVINVDLWALVQSGDTNNDLILQKDDTINIPQAEKLTPEEIERVGNTNLTAPTIRINVVGEVANPGTIEVPSSTPLNQGILAAGGFDNQRAQKGSVELVRINPNGTVSKRKIKIDFANDVNEENNPVLRQNDVIVVRRSGVTTVGDALGTLASPFLGPLRVLNFFGL
ncbi:MAG: SLBB domain-containing protein [Xenococcaceae cyanobacterium MO_188.B29]|nr:SLBB domain-containing protein [Xenococcaceae cyanobacterium MO_188.B29]